MKQAKWVVGLILVTGLVVGGVLIFRDTKAPETGGATKTETVDSGAETTKPAGRYIDYTESTLADATLGTKVLFFYAPWCSQCRQLDASIKAGQVPVGVTIIKVDYDSNQKLRARYGVTIQTSLVRIDDNGNLVKKYVAYDEPSLRSLVENLL